MIFGVFDFDFIQNFDFFFFQTKMYVVCPNCTLVNSADATVCAACEVPSPLKKHTQQSHSQNQTPFKQPKKLAKSQDEDEEMDEVKKKMMNVEKKYILSDYWDSDWLFPFLLERYYLSYFTWIFFLALFFIFVFFNLIQSIVEPSFWMIFEFLFRMVQISFFHFNIFFIYFLFLLFCEHKTRTKMKELSK